jgi:hypothetical protein
MKLDYFFHFQPPSTFLYIKFDIHSFNKFEKKINKLFFQLIFHGVTKH